MKKLVMSCILLITLVIPIQIKANVALPCSLILVPTDTSLTNAKGVALIQKVDMVPNSFLRTGVSIHAVHLPNPATYGNYDRYEGFLIIPEEISWRFPLSPIEEKENLWAGHFDNITAEVDQIIVQVRLSNSKFNRLGPTVLYNFMSECKTS